MWSTRILKKDLIQSCDRLIILFFFSGASARNNHSAAQTVKRAERQRHPHQGTVPAAESAVDQRARRNIILS